MSVTLYDNVVLTVEIGFSTTGGANAVPLGGDLSDIVWTDVSEYVRDLSTRRGRNNELDSFSPGTMSVTLSNTDRRFDPEYAAGPYFGSVTPSRPIRVRAEYDGQGVEDLFFGWVDGWDQQYVQPNDASVVVTATDGFKILNQLTLSGVYDYIFAQQSGVFARYILNDVTGSISLVDSEGAAPLLPVINPTNSALLGGSAGPFTSTTTISAPPMLPETSENSLEFDGLRGANLRNFLPFGTGDVRAASLFIKTSSTTDGNYAVVNIANLTRDGFVFGMIVSNGIGTIKGYRLAYSDGTETAEYVSNIQVNDGEPHLIALCQFNSGQEPSVDGVPMTKRFISSSGISRSTYSLGLPTKDRVIDGSPYFDFDLSLAFVGTMFDFVIWGSSLPDFAELYASGVGLYGVGDTPASQLDDLLNAADWMGDARNIYTGETAMGGLAFAGSTVLDVAKSIELAEQGRLFMAGDGYVTLLGRNTVQTVAQYATSQATFGDGVGELPYTEIEFAYDDRLIFNRSTVQRAGGVPFTANDAVSQGQYFIRSESIQNFRVADDNFSSEVANYHVLIYAQPFLRVESIEVQARSNPGSLFPKIFEYDLGTRITVTRHPQSVGSPISKELLIEGVSHSVSMSNWVTTWTLSPVQIDSFILDSATRGILDTSRLGL